MKKLALALLCVTACTPTPEQYGEQLFFDPAFSASEVNTWSCATCHATTPDDKRTLSGGSLLEAAARPNYWGGNSLRMIDAASFCYVNFMRGVRTFEEDATCERALYSFLASKTKSTNAPAVPFTIVRQVADVPRGDSARGAQVYKAACQDCHGEVSTGAGRNTQRASILPNVKSEYAVIFPGIPPSLVFVEKIRHGQFLGVGGNMPLFSKETISDADLGALLSYLGL